MNTLTKNFIQDPVGGALKDINSKDATLLAFAILDAKIHGDVRTYATGAITPHNKLVYNRVFMVSTKTYYDVIDGKI